MIELGALLTEPRKQIFDLYRPLDLMGVSSPFLSTIEDLDRNGWTKSTHQITAGDVDHDEQTTYTTTDGSTVLFKPDNPDDLFATLYQLGCSAVGESIGLSMPYTAAGIISKPEGGYTVGALSHCVFEETVGHRFGFEKKNIQHFFSLTETSAFTGRCVFSRWVCDFDWRDNLDHIVIGTLGTGNHNRSYCTIDLDRAFGGPTRNAWNIKKFKNATVSEFMWSFMKPSYEDCHYWIEKIMKMPAWLINSLWVVPAKELSKYYSRDDYIALQRRAYEVSNFLISSRPLLERDFKNYYSR